MASNVSKQGILWEWASEYSHHRQAALGARSCTIKGAHENGSFHHFGGEKQVLKISENKVQHGTTQNLVVYTDLPH